MRLVRTWGLIFLLIASARVEARVFNFKNESVASYFRGSIGTSFLGKDAFENSSGAGLTFDQEVLHNYGAEFGVLFSGEQMSLRLGLGVLKPKSIPELLVKDASGQTLYTLRSDITALIPTAGIDLHLLKRDSFRLSFAGAIGFATVDLQNQYSFSDAGRTAYGLENFLEQGQGTTYGYEAYLGFEYLFVDTVTMVLELGYRQLVISTLINKTEFTHFSGLIPEGEVLLNSDGTNRELSLSGPFFGIGFRFYIKTI